MRKHKTITISLPGDLLDYLDGRIRQINRETFEETNRSKYIRLLIRKDAAGLDPAAESPGALLKKPSQTSPAPDDNEMDYYSSLLQLGGYKR
ncbi:ribbon-helix-helix domain-containing protein [Desulfofalx alkaliphila]|uniref:ribbon-helix-helix domain-containing protein n=1 Tax=Desulfofalx alkaliphila TaxID=105483 RepID=UPI0004E150D5|nr:ribbon-helix-helix domain-containing protein [Desulfofalx alkaliphila]